MRRQLQYIDYSTTQLCQDIKRMQAENKMTDYAMNGDIEIVKRGGTYQLKALYNDDILFEFIITTADKSFIYELIAFLNGYNAAVCRQII